MFIWSFRGYVLFTIICMCSTEDEDIEEDVVVRESDDNTTQIEDQDEEEWVNEAVRDVGYYLRAHKFNDFDRRYQTEDNAVKVFHKGFPDPPLVHIHWEVYKYCSKGFKECLGYLQETALRADLYRSIDTATVMNAQGWQIPRNLKSINSLNKECVRLRALDWAKPRPFKGPLERFQWRTSASYYMCWFTMKEVPSLAMFGENCDNTASCIETEFYMAKNYDPRADDRLPFQCALYSFCPDPCCPKRMISSYQLCIEPEENPCNRNNHNDHKCSYQRKFNNHLESIIMNHWNVSCHCKPGFVWESRFEMCVDIDECAAGTDSCNRALENCHNLEGEFTCTCKWGYQWTGKYCEPSISLLEGISAFNEQNQPVTVNSSVPFSLLKYLFNISFALFNTEEPK